MASKGLEAPTKATLQEYNNAIWQKYVDFGTVEFDEEAALKAYENYYREHPPSEDDECFYYGILLFEQGFSSDPPNVEQLLKAREIFSIYRTMEEDWDAINDRLEEVEDILSDWDGDLPTLPDDWVAGVATEETETAPAPTTRQVTPESPRGMVYVHAGEYELGTERKKVTIDAFYMDKHPVTNRKFQEFVEQANYRPSRYLEDDRFNDPNQPVVGVSYMDAVKFAQWAGKQLPTEEQWEAAARGKDGRTFPWGEEEPTDKHANFAPHGEGLSRLQKVGQHPAGRAPCGAENMAGSVWEWTATAHEDHDEHQVIRGGSWVDPSPYMECSARLHAHSKDKQDILGFRCIQPA